MFTKIYGVSILLSIVIILLFIIITLILHFIHNIYSKPKKPKHKSIVGGCSGTRYGCCPDGKTAMVDFSGSNC